MQDHRSISAGSPPSDMVQNPTAAETERWIRAFLRDWWIGVVLTVAGLLAAIAFLHIAKPRYDAFLQIVPVERNTSSLPRNLSGLASLAGINLMGEPTSQFSLAIEALTSRDIAEMIVADDDLMRRIFPEQWDEAAARWRQPADALRGVKELAKTVLAVPIRPWERSGAADVQEFVSRRLTVTEDRQGGFTTLSFRHEDPELARDLLWALYKSADAHLKGRMVTRTEAYIAYLSRKLQEVTIAEHRSALAEALADQERMLMMASSGQPFSADPLGVVAVTERPTSPKLLLVIAIGLAGGLAIGIALILWRNRHDLNLVGRG